MTNYGICGGPTKGCIQFQSMLFKFAGELEAHSFKTSQGALVDIGMMT